MQTEVDTLYTLDIYLEANRHPQIAFHPYKGGWPEDLSMIYATGIGDLPIIYFPALKGYCEVS